MPQRYYFRRSLALLRRDRGWVKPLLALSAASLVPIAGPLGVRGYAMEWARLTAWGVDASPKQKGARVGACIKAGWRAFVVIVVPMLVLGIASSLLRGLANATNVGALVALVGLALSVVSLFLSMFTSIAALHATVYQDIRAGFSYGRIWSMVRADLAGVLRILVLNLVLNLLVALAVGTVASVTLGTMIANVLERYPLWAYEHVFLQVTWAELFAFVADLMQQISAFALPLALIVLLGIMGAVFAQLIVTTSLGLWMREFDVPRWGAYNAPIPQHQVPQLPYPGAPMGGQAPLR